jgi:hypothetical protein
VLQTARAELAKASECRQQITAHGGESSGRQFRQQDLVETVRRALQAADITHSSTEITESKDATPRDHVCWTT